MRHHALFLFALGAGCAGPSDEEEPQDKAPELIIEDRDGDGIADSHEGDGDSDGDGIPDVEDLDSDGDCVPDAVERGYVAPGRLPVDTDRDGLADFQDTDSDNNGVLDRDEAVDCDNPIDTDGDGQPDFVDFDDDADTVADNEEGEADLDGDGVGNRLDQDSDGDCIPDLLEAGDDDLESPAEDTDGDGVPDMLDTDSDDDGTGDSDEATSCADPGDLDGDGVYDHVDPDVDGDGLSDVEEAALGTAYDNSDTDGDGQSDLVEVVGGGDPTDSSTLADATVVEITERTTTELSIPYTLEFPGGDIALVVDTTTSMGSVLAQVTEDISGLTYGLMVDRPSSTLGAARYQEYATAPMSSGNDVPFYLEQQMTDNLEAAVASMLAISIDYSAGNMDFPEAGYEGLYQALTGIGYDLNCDGRFHADEDVLPFLATPEDPFGGAAGSAYDPTDSSTGLIGGMGFHPRSKHIVFVVTDDFMRDPDLGEASGGGCPGDAGSNAVIEAASAIGATFIGLTINNPAARARMEDLANAMGSLGDVNDDGVANEPLAFDYTPGDPGLMAVLSRILTDLTADLMYLDQLSPEVVEDERGFVRSVGPTYENVGERYESGDVITFDVRLWGAVAQRQEAQAWKVTIDIETPDGTLDTLVVIVSVPGR